MSHGIVLARTTLLLLATTLFLEAAIAEENESTASGKDTVSYYSEIRPILQTQCQGCHQPAKPQGDYVMTSFEQLLAGGESGEPAIVAGKPDGSYLMQQIAPDGDTAEMPKQKPPLASVQIALIERWIEQGAIDDTPASAKVHYDKRNPPNYVLPPVITSLDFSPDGSLMAVAGFHEVLLHKSDGSGLVSRLIGMSARIESVRFSPDGKLLAVTGGLPARLGEVQVWDVSKATLTLSHVVTYDTVFGACWSPDGTLIAFGCTDNTIRAIEAKTGKQVLYQGAHSDWPSDTVFSVKGTHVISVASDRTAKLTEVATQRFIDNITSITPGALRGGINAVARHPTKDEILVGGADGVPKLYRVFRQSNRMIGDDANRLRTFPALEGRVFDVAISPDGSRIAAGSSLDGAGEVRIYAYDFDTDTPKDLLAIMNKKPSQRTRQEKKKLAGYRRQGVTVQAETPVPQAGIYTVAFSADGKTLAAAGSDGIVRLIDAASGSIKKTFSPVPVDSMTEMAMTDGSRSDVKRRWRRTANTQRQTLRQEDKIASIDVQPAEAKLNAKYDVIQFLVTARLESGDLLDVTRMADVSLSTDAIEISSRGLARATAKGRVEATFSVGGKSATAVIDVADSIESEFHPSYFRDVMPAISKLGCNAGTCHGANKGKAGFKLSLRGNDGLFDARAYCDDVAARRINRASPDDSLLLLKAAAGVPHEGGQLTQPGEPYYEIIRKWIGDGAALDTDSPRVSAIEIFPKNPIVQRIDAKQQFRVVATYTDRTIRDVTADANMQVGNIEVAAADEAGLVSVLRRGETPVLARFEGRYAATTLTVMGDRSGFVWTQPPAHNYIDELVAAKLQRAKTLPSDLCSDAEFVRRVYLDLTGLPPTVDELREFMADKRDTRAKRDELIDRLIGSEEYIEHWTNKSADMLQVNRKYLGEEGSLVFRKWIREEVAANTPYDDFARKILTATGSNKDNPAASYFKIHREPGEAMENTTQLFLGVRFSCNKCHDHPFERWFQDQYYQMAAYFAQVELKKDPASGHRQIGKTAVEAGKPLFEIVSDKNSGEVTHERTGAITAPRFPFQARYDAPPDATRREHLAHWITSPDNQYFAKSYVNRLWGYLLGVGLIEPLDDIRAGNPPTNPELLARLTEDFVASGFDVRHMVRMICKSRTYQLSISTNRWNEDDEINYSHALARRLPAEVLYDAIHRVTGSTTKLPGMPAGSRAAQLPDAGATLADGFLTTLGRPPRESACECERSTGLQLGPVMALVSGPTLNNAISDPDNALSKLAISEMDNEQLVKELYLRVLNRPASDKEVESGVALVRGLSADHDRLVAELKRCEQQEKTRRDAIALAQKELADYKAQTAERQTQRRQEQPNRVGADEATQGTATQETGTQGTGTQETGTQDERLPADAKLQQLQDKVTQANAVRSVESKLAQLRHDVELSRQQLANPRLTAAQDIAWALMNSPAFLFNR